MARRDFGPPQEKPYAFVPIAPIDRGDREFPKGHERYHEGTVSGRLDATLVVLKPLHVSSGQMRLCPGRSPSLVQEMTRVNGQPCVPASTLKGVVRSVVEAITRSCVRVTRVRPHQLPANAAGCRRKENLCVACRMFGSLGFEGHVRFDDAVLEEGRLGLARMPALYAPRSRSGAYYEGGRIKGRKFYKHGRTLTDARKPVEILRPESRLPFRVRFDNLTEAQVGVLLTALGLGEPSFVLKLGGGKPACYGSALILDDYDLHVWLGAQGLYERYDVEDAAASPDEYLRKARSLVVEEHLERLKVVWNYDMSRRCPEGNY